LATSEITSIWDSTPVPEKWRRKYHFERRLCQRNLISHLTCLMLDPFSLIFPIKAKGTLNLLGSLFLAYTPFWCLGVFSVHGRSLRCSSKHCSQTRLVCFYQRPYTSMPILEENIAIPQEDHPF
jgi:hypothetical protein